MEPLVKTPSGTTILSFVKRLSSFRGDYLYRVCYMSSFGLSFVGRFQLDLNQYPLFGGFTGLEGNIGCQIFGGGEGLEPPQLLHPSR